MKHYTLLSKFSGNLFPISAELRLIRGEDLSGISGTGHVVDGVQFEDGKVVTRWRSPIAQTCVWDSIEDVQAIHGHNGATVIEWID